MAGEAVMKAARRKGVNVLPVDSEHNAIFQCLENHMAKRSGLAGESVETAAQETLSCEVRRLILTASGGPFRTWPAEKLAAVTIEQALKHPTWTMGAKITIDSATLFNKGLEMIEARWLFDVEMARVDVIVHPQSIVHSMVEFIDSSVLAQLSVTDMCFPIQYAVTWPERVPNTLPPLDFARIAKLDFEAPRRADFPALDLARAAGEAGGALPARPECRQRSGGRRFSRAPLRVSRDLANGGAGHGRASAGCGRGLGCYPLCRLLGSIASFRVAWRLNLPRLRASISFPMSTLKIIGILLEVLLLFNLLIVVHELGHFLAAKWRGLVIEGFGIWFGKPIWQKKIGGVTYSLGSIPAGGFVKLPQLMDSAIEGESEFAGKELPRLKPVDKIIVGLRRTAL